MGNEFGVAGSAVRLLYAETMALTIAEFAELREQLDLPGERECN